MSGRTRALQAAAGLGLAVVAGVVVDRRFGGRSGDDPAGDDGVTLGSLHGERYTVHADDGLDLHAEVDEIAPYTSEAPRPEQATVVFAHGFALTSDCWHFQRRAFRGKRRMVFYDQRSHGRSGRSEQANATIDQLGHDLKSVMDALAPDQKVVLVGHSMGGMAVVALAEQHLELFGDRVVGVALISTTAGGMRSHKILSRYVPDALGRRVVERGLLLAASRERILELARQRGSAFGLWVIEEFAFGRGRVPPEYVVFLDSMISSTPLKVLVEFIPQFDALDKFNVVKAFERVPTWIMCGTKDKLTSVGHSRKLRAHIDGARLVEFPGGGHMPIFEFPDKVNAALEQLFEEADRLVGGES